MAGAGKPSMRVLFLTGSPAHYMAPPQLGVSQINCGPDWPDQMVEGRVVSLKTPAGAYDAGALARRLPVTQRPDAVVCLVDAARRNLPANLRVFRCPKVLLVADTHHLHAPITQMLQYAGSEPFDRIVILYDRHHLEFFRSAGLKNLFWFPGLTFPHSDEVVKAARTGHRISRIAFVGQTGGLHPRRARLLRTLSDAGLPITVQELPQREAMDLCASSSIGFNASLNGDLNLRTFEILASGALLLTDRLAAVSGMNLLWQDQREIVSYDSPEELQEIASYLIGNPATCGKIARQGRDWFDRVMNESGRRRAFEDLAANGKSVPEFALPPAPDRVWFSVKPAAPHPAIRVYEFVQELHRTRETVKVTVDGGVSEEWEQMGATLPRVRIEATLARDSDLLVTSRAALVRYALGDCARVWIYDGNQTAFSAVMARHGLFPIDRELSLFGRVQEEIEAALPPGRRAWLMVEKGDYPRAMDLARATLALNPRDLDALVSIADLALEVNNPSLAERLMRDAVQIAPADGRVAALRRCLDGATRPAQLPRRLLSAGRVLAANQTWSAAASAVGQAVQLDPNLDGGQLLLGQILINLGDYDAAGAAFREASKAGESVELWNAVGMLMLKTEKAKDAADAFRNALRLDSLSASSLHGLADAAVLGGDWTSEEEAVRTLQRIAPSSPNVQLHLGHMLKRQGKAAEALDCYRRAAGAGSYETGERRRAKPRVVFLVQHGPSWACTESIWQAFEADAGWETLIVALPYRHPLYNRAQNDTNGIFEFLRGRSIPHLRWDEFSLQPGCADLMFVQNPYDVTRPLGWQVPDLLRSVPRLAYVPYGIEIGGGDANANNQFNQLIQQVAWAVFARSDRHRRMFTKRCAAGDSHVYVTGHPKMDAQRELAAARDPELTEFVAGRRTVLWNPQFDVRPNGTRFGGGFSTFLRWRDFMVAEFARRPDMAFIIRPHPLFFGTMEARGILTPEQIETWLQHCAAAGNIHIDRRASYLPAFAAADAMLSDASSFLLEYAGTGKPLLYLHNPHGPSLNEDGTFVTEFCGAAETEEEIRAFLDDAAANRDSRGAERMAAYREYMYIPAGGVGRKIKEIICSRLEAELVHPGLSHLGEPETEHMFSEGENAPVSGCADRTGATID